VKAQMVKWGEREKLFLSTLRRRVHMGRENTY
jgi:hypothetical protein